MREHTHIDLIDRALRIAARAHEGQTRKQDSTPYITHPVAAAFLLMRHDFSDTAVAAALVHDVVEDSECTIADIEQALGASVARIVDAVTEDVALPWEERKRRYIASVRRGSVEAKAVSVADKIHNLGDLLDAYAKEGQRVWERFSRGRAQQEWFADALLGMFRETWKHPLVDVYGERVAELHALPRR